MGDNVANVPDVQQRPVQQQNPQTSPWEVMKSLASRMLMMYAVVTAMNYFRGKPGQSGSNSSSSGGDAIADFSENMFQKGTLFVSK